MYEDLGRRIREQRKLLKMTQEALAEKAEISNSFLGHIERGSRKASLDTLVKICNALQVSPNILLRDSLESGLFGENIDDNPRRRRLLREMQDAFIAYEQYSDEIPQELHINRPEGFKE